MSTPSYTQTTDEASLKKLGIDTYLQKPFSIDEMMQAVSGLTMRQTQLSEWLHKASLTQKQKKTGLGRFFS